MMSTPTRAVLAASLVEKEVLLENATDSLELLSERLAELELAIEDQGWTAFGNDSDREFSNQALARLIRFARFSYLKNPLINHGVGVQADYVFGQGVDIKGRDLVNDVVQQFLDDKSNLHTVGDQSAWIANEVQLQTEGSVFFALFTNASTGRVQVRIIPTLEFLSGDIITDPNDRDTPWYYKRVYMEKSIDLQTGAVAVAQKTCYYPDWRYRPATKPNKIGSLEVMWDVPIYHVKAGGLRGMRFGVPEVYSALDWARSVKEDLEDYSSVRKALTRFAWLLTTRGGKAGIAAAKKKLASTLSTPIASGSPETNPPPVTGSAFITSSDGAALQPVRTAGAQPSPDEGRRLWLMVAAGMGIPETILSGDANVGNMATAKTLDRPTELKMRSRQTFWAGHITNILGYAIDASGRAPSGLLPGKVEMDPITQEEVVVLGQNTTGSNGPVDLSSTIDVDFPPILEKDAKDRVSAIVTAATLDGKTKSGTLTDKTLVTLLLSALSVDDIDEVLDLLFPDGATDLAPSASLLPPVVVPGVGLGVGHLPAPGTPPSPTAPYGEMPPAIIEAIKALTEAIDGLGREDALVGS